MLELELTARDLVATRFAISPLWEVVASVKVLRHPARHAPFAPWIGQALPRLSAGKLDWRLLADLVPEPPLRIPAFIAPPPRVPLPDLELELEQLGATPHDVVVKGLRATSAPRSARLERMLADPEAGLRELATVIEAYWEIALAPYWPRMRTLLEGDLLHRARTAAQRGLEHVLSDLDPGVSLEDATLSIRHRYVAGVLSLGGRGLLLVPSVFAWPNVYSIAVPGWQPTVRYPPRGIGTLWEQRGKPAPSALSGVIGQSKALILTELSTPASTSELATRLSLTPGGISQHLKALSAAGLVAAHRSGRFVLYARTAAAEALLTAAAQAA